MAFSFQVAEVVRPLRVTARRALAVSMKLQRRAVKAAPAAVRAQLAKLRESTRRLDESFTRGPSAPRDARAEARACVAAWSVLHGNLQGVARLDGTAAPEAAEASAIVDAVFPDGVGWVRGDHESIWVRGQHCLDAIQKGGHDEALERLVGAYLMKAVRGAHHAFGVVLGLAGSMHPPSFAEGPALDQRPLLDAVTADIAAYALQVVASADAHDDASAREAAYALEPILAARARSRAQRAADDADDAEQPAHPDAPALPSAPVANDAARRVA